MTATAETGAGTEVDVTMTAAGTTTAVAGATTIMVAAGVEGTATIMAEGTTAGVVAEAEAVAEVVGEVAGVSLAPSVVARPQRELLPSASASARRVVGMSMHLATNSIQRCKRSKLVCSLFPAQIERKFRLF